MTSPGHLDGGDARARLGYPGAGPTRVITDLGVFDVTPQGLKVVELAPGVTHEFAQSKTGVKLH